jgi:hypothetical protein
MIALFVLLRSKVILRIFRSYNAEDLSKQRCIWCCKGKEIPLQAFTGPEGSRRLRLSDFKTIGTWRWQGCQPYAPVAVTPRKYSWYSFLLETGHSAAGRMPMKNSNETIGNRSRDLPVCSPVPQPLRHRVPLRQSVPHIKGKSLPIKCHACTEKG